MEMSSDKVIDKASQNNTEVQPAEDAIVYPLRKQRKMSSAPVVYRRRYLDLTWKSMRKANESKYSFSNIELARQRIHVKGTDKEKIKKPSMKKELEKPVVKTQIDGPFVDDILLMHDLHHDTDTACKILMDSDMTMSDHSNTRTELSVTEIYMYELKSNNGISLCDNTLKKFVLQDFCVQRKCLKPRSFVFVTRAGKCYSGDHHWVYWCSCDVRRAELIDSISSRVDTTFEEAATQLPECLHITVIRKIAEEDIDGVYGISPQHDFEDHSYAAKGPKFPSDEEYSDYFSIGNEGAVCIKVDNTDLPMGIVVPSERGPVCLSNHCKNQKRTCAHIQHILKLSTGDVPEILKFVIDSQQAKEPTASKSPQNQLLSTKRIPFKLPVELQHVLKIPSSERFNTDLSGVCHLTGDLNSPCGVCGQINWSEREVTSATTIIAQNCAFKAVIHSRKCDTIGCIGILAFEGQSKGLLVMKSHCILYEVLRHHMHQFLLGRTTIYTQYTVLCEDHADAGNQNFSSILTYNQYRFAWYSFISLLDIDYKNGFLCSTCGTDPTVVIMDATSLAFRKDLLTWQAFLKTPTVVNRRPGSVFNDRVFLPNAKARKLLSNYASSGLSSQDISDMIELLNEYSPSAATIVSSIMSDQETKFSSKSKSNVYRCPSDWESLMKSLASTSPVCALLHPSDSVAKLISSMKEKDITKDAILMQKLQEEIPIVFTLIRSVAYYPQKILIPLLEEMWTKAKAPFNIEDDKSDDAAVGSDEYHIDDLSYFPSLPRVRSRGVYVADKKSNDSICTKRSSKHPALLPGIFTLFCEHGVCYGFKVMTVTESPNTAFTVLFEHLRKAPSVIIYDNACNLHQYILNREPVHFKSSWLLVDRFHWPNHTGCSAGYKLDSYCQFDGINSQIVEQSNSLLKRIKGSLSYMNPQNFISHLKFYLWHKNSLSL